MDAADQKEQLQKFVNYALTLTGDEKGEAQLFLDHLFRAFGHAGITEAGATLEWRVPKRPDVSSPDPQLELIKTSKPKAKAAGKKFADLLWPSRVLIEMKSRGEHLEKHYDQAFDYWSHIVPHRPPYVIICNFDEFWIYDFNTQLFDPVDKVPLAELPERWSSFTFLLPYERKPIFDNNRVAVTRKAAALLSQVFAEIVARGEDRGRTQRFILQLLVALVSEDLNLLPGLVVTEAIRDAIAGQSAYDLLGGLFRQMNSPEKARGGRWQGVDYFNGGLFAMIDPVEIKTAELYALENAARENWSKVKPEIFGTIFQASMDIGERHAYGAHFTSEFDIQKVVTPTITRPWRERIENAGKRSELLEILGAIRRFRVLDPACGSGNFLYVAYRELKRLERRLLVRLREMGQPPEQLVSAVSLQQFFGIDVIPFAVELARVTLMLAKELELLEAKKIAETDGMELPEKPLPLDNLDKQIICADSLFTPWPKADAIIGNPPFQSKNKMQQEFGADYVKKIREAYPGIPGRADFCVYWFRKAHDHLAPGGRAGLVGTNTIRQNYSREGGLDYVVANGGTITDAVSTQVWSGDAAVHVSIVNWTKGDAPGSKHLTLQKGDRSDSPWESFFLPQINAALSTGTDVTSAQRLETNANADACFQGQTHGHKGFLLQPAEAEEIKREEPRCAEVIYPFLTADDMLANHDSLPSRFVIDFQRRDVIEASSYRLAYERVKSTVLVDRQEAAQEEEKRNKVLLDKDKDAKVNRHHANFLKQWWRLSWGREELVTKIATLPRYFACGQVTKRPIFEFISKDIRPNAALIVFPFADDYSFGILQSGIHFDWFKARCSTLKGDFRYTSDTVFDTFPWPQKPSLAAIRNVAKAAVTLRTLRREIMNKLKYSLRDLYRTLDEPGENPLRDAHAALDAAVREAYGMSAEADALAFLLELNLACAACEKEGKAIAKPGLPPIVKNPAEFITADCVSMPT